MGSRNSTVRTGTGACVSSRPMADGGTGRAQAERAPKTRARYVMVGLSMGVRLVNFVQCVSHTPADRDIRELVQNVSPHPVWGLLATDVGVCACRRLGLPSLIPFIVNEYQFSEAQRALLLGGFFPGYCLTMVPAGLISTRFGYKNILSLNLAGNALVLLATPIFAGLSPRLGVAPLFCCFATMGLLQGPLVPAMALCHRNWMPAGPERAWGLRMYSLGGRVGTVLTRISIPFLSIRWGWRAVAYVYGGVSAIFAVLWHTWAANSAEDWIGPPRMNNEERSFLGAVNRSSTGEQQQKQAEALPWYLLRAPAALIVCVCHVASNSVAYSLDTWSPIYFSEVLGCDPLDVGKLLAIPSTVSFAATFLSGGLETTLNARGVSLINIRRWMEGTACVAKSVAIAAFACCRRPKRAIFCVCVIELFSTFHNSGHTASYLEVGGANCGLLKSVGNTFANMPGYIVPIFGLFCKQRTGSYSALFFVVSLFQLAAGVAYAQLVCTTAVVAPNVRARQL